MSRCGQKDTFLLLTLTVFSSGYVALSQTYFYKYA